MSKHQPKKLFAYRRSRNGCQARQISISLYPSHKELLALRERELNVHRSVLVQILLEIEERHGFLRGELRQRLTSARAATCQQTN